MRVQGWKRLGSGAVIWIAGALVAPAAGDARQATTAPPSTDDSLPRFEEDACPFDEAELPEGVAVRCGWLTVWQNRSHPEGGTLRLAVALLPPADSAVAAPAPDPLVFLSGGPGGAAVRFAPLIVRSARWREIHPDRTLILYDQRGTGYSEPRFCPELDREVRRAQYGGLSRDSALDAERRAFAECRERMLADGVDFSVYNSATSALDLDDLRRILGYEAWNLVGGSYGTRLALTAMRDTPEGSRAVILDSTTPPDSSAGHWASYTDNLARSLRLVFDQCAGDPACREAFPTLEDDFYAMLGELEREPVVIALSDTTRFPDGRITIDGTLMTGGVHQALYDQRLIPLVPLLVREIRAGNVAVLEALAEGVAPDPATLSVGLQRAVECYELAPFTSPESIAAERARYPQLAVWLEDPFRSDNLALCDAWHGERAPPRIGAPVVSDIPTLVLAGEFDPITPPHDGRLAAETLSRSTFVEIRGIGHGAVPSSACARRIAVAFLDRPEVAPPTACADSVAPLAFVTDVRIAPGVMRAGRALEAGLPMPWLVALGAAGLVWLSALLGWPIGALVRRRRGTARVSRPAKSARWVAALAVLLGLGFVAGAGLAITRTAGVNPYVLAFGLPGEWRALFLIPPLFVAATLAVLAMAVLAWRRGWWSAFHRAHYGLVGVACLGLAVVLIRWGFLA